MEKSIIKLILKEKDNEYSFVKEYLTEAEFNKLVKNKRLNYVF